MEAEPRTEKKPRSLFGCVFSGALGCGAFFFGAALSAGLFAPWLLGDWVKKGFESSFHSRHDGQLRIGHLQLSWRGPQKATDVKLLEPENNSEVLVVDAVLPSLLTMLGLRAEDWEAEVDVKYGRLEVDGEGRSNLGLALRDRGRPVGWFDYIESFAEVDASGELSDGPAAEVVVNVRAEPGTVTLFDARSGEEAIALDGVDAGIVRGRDGEVVIRGKVGFDEGREMRAMLTRPYDDPAWWATVEGETLPTRVFDSFVGGAGRLIDLVGEECRASLRFDADEDSGGSTEFSGELESDDTQLSWRLFHSDGELRSRGSQKSVVVNTSLGPRHTEVIRWLFPWIRAAEGRSGEQVEFAMHNVQMSTDDIPTTLDTVVTLQLGTTRYTPIEAFGNTVALTATMFAHRRGREHGRPHRGRRREQTTRRAWSSCKSSTASSRTRTSGWTSTACAARSTVSVP